MLNFGFVLEHLQVPLNLLFKKLSNLHLYKPIYLPILPLSPSEVACLPLIFLTSFGDNSVPPKSSYMQK